MADFQDFEDHPERRSRPYSKPLGPTVVNAWTRRYNLPPEADLLPVRGAVVALRGVATATGNYRMRVLSIAEAQQRAGSQRQTEITFFQIRAHGTEGE